MESSPPIRGRIREPGDPLFPISASRVVAERERKGARGKRPKGVTRFSGSRSEARSRPGHATRWVGLTNHRPVLDGVTGPLH
jgi:hypothetical protein